MSKIKIVAKATGKEVEFKSSRKLFSELYSPYMEDYLDYSDVFVSILKRFQDAPLVKYRLTESDKKRIEKNPDAINDIPRYYVPGYDRSVGEEFCAKMRREFYTKFMSGSKVIVRFINDTNRNYCAYLVG